MINVKPGGQKPIGSAVFFLNDLKWPSTASYGLQCRRSAENVKHLNSKKKKKKFKKKKIQKIFFLTTDHWFTIRKKIWRNLSSHFPTIDLSNLSGFTVRTLYILTKSDLWKTAFKGTTSLYGEWSLDRISLDRISWSKVSNNLGVWPNLFLL